ncbi:hypothetical protein [Haloferula sargassicola]|uniref:Uncharacterized protein n=1 Tax=Haloferula sargassicola TaxID=490096 RepID=A0ABP9UPL1_9BACT
MKTKMILAACAALLSPLSQAEEPHHHEKITAPNGGRVLTSVEPHLEFYRMDDGKVKITAVDDDGKVRPIGDTEVTVTGGERSKPTRLTFSKNGDALISDKAFPEGKSLPVVVRIKTSADAKPVYERFSLNLATCPECEHPEYACSCEHDHDH